MWGATQNKSPNPMLLGSRLADFIVDGVNTIKDQWRDRLGRR
jgi:hypothetical protein